MVSDAAQPAQRSGMILSFPRSMPYHRLMMNVFRPVLVGCVARMLMLSLCLPGRMCQVLCGSQRWPRWSIMITEGYSSLRVTRLCTLQQHSKWLQSIPLAC